MSSVTRKHVVVVHGSYGNPTENWFPWLAEQVQSYGHSVTIPALPTPAGQSIDAWKRAFREQVGSLTANMLLVGHSMGVGFALRLLEESEQEVVGTFLAAGFIGALGLPDYDPINATFFARPFDWHKIRQNAGRVYVYAGDNDPYVPVERTNEIAHHLATTLQVIPGGGHLNAETGFVTFPQMWEEIKPLLAG